MAALGLCLEEPRGQRPEFFVREGVRILLTVGLEAEVTE